MSSEYLTNFRPELSEKQMPSLDHILTTGEPVAKNELIKFLVAANSYLINTPGPNQERRQKLSNSWLKHWINLLINMDDAIHGRIVTIDNLHKIVSQNQSEGESTSVLFAGGFEGHIGHVSCLNHMLECINHPIVLLERDEYVGNKERRHPFLPLEVRLSMTAYYSNRLIVSVLPKPDESIESTNHYNEIFQVIGAEYCFAESGDPLATLKRSRGKDAEFTLIPHVDTPSTTERVKL
jgi:glycerol-3-phosphate cytidylyltransferase-like family protein